MNTRNSSLLFLFRFSAAPKRVFFYTLLVLLSIAPFESVYAQYNSEYQAAKSQKGKKSVKLETLIEHYLGKYPFTHDNRFKLSAYTELKGQYSEQNATLTLGFGTLGTMFFFEQNCLLRTARNEIYYLNAGDKDPARIKAINEGVQEMFEQINLLSNHEHDAHLIAFVDKHLAKKNIEPFYKIFVRHILIKYGRYDKKQKAAIFHTDWLPENTYTYNDSSAKRMVKKHISPLKIVLTEGLIMGYYLDIGGEVYINDEARDVFFVTGEDYKYNNVTAFKLFAQRLFAETIQYVANEESQRIAAISYDKGIRDGLIAKAANSKHASTGSNKQAAAPYALYSPWSWIQMMLSILRNNYINIGEPEIIKYFANQPYFDRIYNMLNAEERKAVDRFIRKHQ